MIQKLRQLGAVKLVQIQPDGMIVEKPDLAMYDSTRRTFAERLTVTVEGISAENAQGEMVLDIHHQAHPETHYKPGNSVSIGFTSHYRAMRERFGEHIVDGSAGENVIIEFPEEVWLEDLGSQLLFENPETGETALLDLHRVAKPCKPFTHFVADSPHESLPAEELKSALQFLSDGRRGFLLTLNREQESAYIHPGDLVYVVGDTDG